MEIEAEWKETWTEIENMKGNIFDMKKLCNKIYLTAALKITLIKKREVKHDVIMLYS